MSSAPQDAVKCRRQPCDDPAVSVASERGVLPQYDNPPVMEIVGAAQFRALPRFGLPEIVRLGDALAAYELRELQPQLPPLQEGAPGRPEQPQLLLGFGPQPQRALYFRQPDERFVAQLQQDRIAINERRVPPDSDEDPSSEHVWPELERLAERVRLELVVDGADHGPDRTTFVELTYVNAIKPADRVWQQHGELHRVLSIVSPSAGEEPWASVERASVRFSFPLLESDRFRGRLHVSAEPVFDEGTPMFNLNLIARRLVDESESLEAAFGACHRDAVRAFTAITTPEIQAHWGRTR